MKTFKQKKNSTNFKNCAIYETLCTPLCALDARVRTKIRLHVLCLLNIVCTVAFRWFFLFLCTVGIRRIYHTRTYIFIYMLVSLGGKTLDRLDRTIFHVQLRGHRARYLFCIYTDYSQITILHATMRFRTECFMKT